MVWDPAASTMRAIVDALTAPRLATVDLCTGTITAGPRITRRSDAGGDGGALTHAECIARLPLSESLRRLWQVQPGDAGLILSADLVTDAGSAKFFDSLVAAPAPICP